MDKLIENQVSEQVNESELEELYGGSSGSGGCNRHDGLVNYADGDEASDVVF